MYDSDELMGWICMRAMRLNGKPLTRFTINCYKSYMKECLKVFESSGYDTFSESFINFYKKYLRKKHHNNYAKVYDKVFAARKLYECLI